MSRRRKAVPLPGWLEEGFARLLKAELEGAERVESRRWYDEAAWVELTRAALAYRGAVSGDDGGRKKRR